MTPGARGPIRHMHKVLKLADQPGGLKALTDIELDAYVHWLRAGHTRSRFKKGRHEGLVRLRAAEDELKRRSDSDTAP